MTAKGVEFLQDWIAKNITKDPVDAGLLAAKLVADAAVSGFTLADLELDSETAPKVIYARSWCISPSRERRGIERVTEALNVSCSN